MLIQDPHGYVNSFGEFLLRPPSVNAIRYRDGSDRVKYSGRGTPLAFFLTRAASHPFISRTWGRSSTTWHGRVSPVTFVGALTLGAEQRLATVPVRNRGSLRVEVVFRDPGHRVGDRDVPLPSVVVLEGSPGVGLIADLDDVRAGS